MDSNPSGGGEADQNSPEQITELKVSEQHTQDGPEQEVAQEANKMLYKGVNYDKAFGLLLKQLDREQSFKNAQAKMSYTQLRNKELKIYYEKELKKEVLQFRSIGSNSGQKLRDLNDPEVQEFEEATKERFEAERKEKVAAEWKRKNKKDRDWTKNSIIYFDQFNNPKVLTNDLYRQLQKARATGEDETQVLEIYKSRQNNASALSGRSGRSIGSAHSKSRQNKTQANFNKPPAHQRNSSGVRPGLPRNPTQPLKLEVGAGARAQSASRQSRLSRHNSGVPLAKKPSESKLQRSNSRQGSQSKIGQKTSAERQLERKRSRDIENSVLVQDLRNAIDAVSQGRQIERKPILKTIEQEHQEAFNKVSNYVDALIMMQEEAIEKGDEIKRCCEMCYNYLCESAMLPCRHYFCKQCLKVNKSYTSKCPICGFAVPDFFRLQFYFFGVDMNQEFQQALKRTFPLNYEMRLQEMLRKILPEENRFYMEIQIGQYYTGYENPSNVYTLEQKEEKSQWCIFVRPKSQALRKIMGNIISCTDFVIPERNPKVVTIKQPQEHPQIQDGGSKSVYQIQTILSRNLFRDDKGVSTSMQRRVKNQIVVDVIIYFNREFSSSRSFQKPFTFEYPLDFGKKESFIDIRIPFDSEKAAQILMSQN